MLWVNFVLIILFADLEVEGLGEVVLTGKIDSYCIERLPVEPKCIMWKNGEASLVLIGPDMTFNHDGDILHDILILCVLGFSTIFNECVAVIYFILPDLMSGTENMVLTSM